MTEFEQDVAISSYIAEWGNNHYSSIDLGDLKCVVLYAAPILKGDKAYTTYSFFDENGKRMFKLQKDEEYGLRILDRNKGMFITLCDEREVIE